MFGKKVDAKPVGRIDSLIGAGTLIEGRVRFSGGLRVDGQIKGDVEAVDATSSVLVVSDQAQIEGNVKVAHLVLNGSIVGDVHVETSLEMQPKARIVGDVTYRMIEMHQGAVIEGRLVHTAQVEEQTENPAD